MLFELVQNTLTPMADLQYLHRNYRWVEQIETTSNINGFNETKYGWLFYLKRCDLRFLLYCYIVS